MTLLTFSSLFPHLHHRDRELKWDNPPYRISYFLHRHLLKGRWDGERTEIGTWGTHAKLITTNWSYTTWSLDRRGTGMKQCISEGIRGDQMGSEGIRWYAWWAAGAESAWAEFGQRTAGQSEWPHCLWSFGRSGEERPQVIPSDWILFDSYLKRSHINRSRSPSADWQWRTLRWRTASSWL